MQQQTQTPSCPAPGALLTKLVLLAVATRSSRHPEPVEGSRSLTRTTGTPRQARDDERTGSRLPRFPGTGRGGVTGGRNCWQASIFPSSAISSGQMTPHLPPESVAHRIYPGGRCIGIVLRTCSARDPASHQPGLAEGSRRATNALETRRIGPGVPDCAVRTSANRCGAYHHQNGATQIRSARRARRGEKP
jgi:hypothetical protein